MPKTITEIQERLESGAGKGQIQRAIQHEARLKLHSETSLSEYDVSGVRAFLSWVSDLIPTEKYHIFLDLFRYPVLTNELVGEIYNQLYRVFSGRNRAFNYQFTDTRLRDDWEYYRQEVLGDPGFWQSDVWSAIQTQINSLVVVDMPRERSGGLPQPYIYLLPASSIIGFEGDPEMEWVAFRQENDHVAYFDREQRVLLKEESGKYTVVGEQRHGLGRTPARFMWTDNISTAHPGVKKSPLTRQLTRLDWLLFFETSKKHLDLYAAYPIYSAYDQDCDYSDPQTGAICDGGHLKGDEGYVLHGGRVARCPVCADNRLVGVGSMISVPPPTEGIDMRKPVEITTIDKDSLDYNVGEVKRLKEDIYNSSVGRGNELFGEAVNEMQVAAGFETKTTILFRLKSNLEAIMQWVTEIVCRERYGGGFVDVSIDLGTEFYVYTLKDLYEKYKEAKENGSTDIILDTLQDKIIELEHMNNPVEMQRVMVLKHLEPYRHLTKKEAVDLYKSGIISDLGMLKVKVNFSSLIQRFEREQTNIIEFGANMEFAAKIRTVKQTLLNYANEEKESPGQKQAGGSQNGGRPGAEGAGAESTGEAVRAEAG